MIRESGYDLQTWKSFPSSLVTTSDETFVRVYPAVLEFNPGSTLTIEGLIKGEKVWSPAFIGWFLDAEKKWFDLVFVPEAARTAGSPDELKGTFDWIKVQNSKVAPPETRFIRLECRGGRPEGYPPPPQPTGEIGKTWFDDLRVYQDGVLIYADDFTAPLAKAVIEVAPSLIVGSLLTMWGLS